VNGVSTSLPFEVQLAFIRTIEGLENAEIIRTRDNAVGILDYCLPHPAPSPPLETKRVGGLYFSPGQNQWDLWLPRRAGGPRPSSPGANAALKVASASRPLF